MAGCVVAKDPMDRDRLTVGCDTGYLLLMWLSTAQEQSEFTGTRGSIMEGVTVGCSGRLLNCSAAVQNGDEA